MLRLSITSSFEIAAAHELPYHKGKCHRLHGHNYRLEFTRYGERQSAKPLSGRKGDDEIRSDAGMVMDFGDFDAAIKLVIELLDHYCLNDLIENPTAENLACWLLDQLPLVHRVVVWETGRHCATAERTDAD